MFAAVRSMSFLAGWIVCLAVWMECDWDSGRYYSSKDYGCEYPLHSWNERSVMLTGHSVLSDAVDIG